MQPIAGGRSQASPERRAAGPVRGIEPAPDRRTLPDSRAFERSIDVARPLTTSADSATARPRKPVCTLDQRAQSLWPRLDRRALSRCGCDPGRIARYIARRTSLPLESIMAMLMEP